MADVIDLNSARAGLGPAAQPHPIRDALDQLALALANHGHEWTQRERQLYESAVSYVASGGYTGSGSSA